MKIPPLEAIQAAVSLWMTRWRESREKRQLLRDEHQAYLEEEARQAAIAADVTERQRLAALERVEELVGLAAEGLRLANARAHLHLDYLGSPVSAYVYATREGTVVAGYNGPPITLVTLNLKALLELERLLHPALGELRAKVVAYETQGEKEVV